MLRRNPIKAVRVTEKIFGNLRSLIMVYRTLLSNQTETRPWYRNVDTTFHLHSLLYHEKATEVQSELAAKSVSSL